jgi:hypothetical protein
MKKGGDVRVIDPSESTPVPAPTLEVLPAAVAVTAETTPKRPKPEAN